jgi:hypothetical protein
MMRLTLIQMIQIKQTRLRRSISRLVQFYRNSPNNQFSRVHSRKNHEKNKRRKSKAAPGSFADGALLRWFQAGASNRGSPVPALSQANPACSGRDFFCVAKTTAGTGLAKGLLLTPGAKYVQAIPQGIHE